MWYYTHVWITACITEDKFLLIILYLQKLSTLLHSCHTDTLAQEVRVAIPIRNQGTAQAGLDGQPPSVKEIIPLPIRGCAGSGHRSHLSDIQTPWALPKQTFNQPNISQSQGCTIQYTQSTVVCCTFTTPTPHCVLLWPSDLELLQPQIQEHSVILKRITVTKFTVAVNYEQC